MVAAEKTEALSDSFHNIWQLLQTGALEEADRELQVMRRECPGHADTYALESFYAYKKGTPKIAERFMEMALLQDASHAGALAIAQHISQEKKKLAQDPYIKNYLKDRPVYLDYPKQIAIETVGRCNANCVFCPHETLDRKFESMDDDLFEKIMKDLEEIPSDLPITIFPNIVNEPFMDKKIFERLTQVNERLPNATLCLISNFNVLPKDFFDRIWNLKRVAGLNISFNAAEKEEYERTMRIDFDRTVEHIKRFMTENRQRKWLRMPLALSRISDKTERDKEFNQQCRELFSEFKEGEEFVSEVRMRANWLGAITQEQTPIPYAYPCYNWLQVNIFCDGTVPHCCMDAHGDFKIGNVKEKSLLDIYNEPHFRNLRETMVTREAAYPCNSCSLR